MKRVTFIHGKGNATVVFGPDDNTDGAHLLQLDQDGSFWIFHGSLNHGWFGGNQVNIATKNS